MPFLIVRSQLFRIVFVIVVIVVVIVVTIVFLGGQVLSPHHYEQMSQRSEVSKITQMYLNQDLTFCLFI